jgi:hypothetical protein
MVNLIEIDGTYVCLVRAMVDVFAFQVGCSNDSVSEFMMIRSFQVAFPRHRKPNDHFLGHISYVGPVRDEIYLESVPRFSRRDQAHRIPTVLSKGGFVASQTFRKAHKNQKPTKHQPNTVNHVWTRKRRQGGKFEKTMPARLPISHPR